jgi:phospholipid/cholesterol/gamma-HCH transport system substrate-binding protein
VPTQGQVRWAQLRVGITVIVASVVLAFVIFLMTGTTGLFADTLELRAYFENAGGLRVGATSPPSGSFPSAAPSR